MTPTAGKQLVFTEAFSGAKGSPPNPARWSTYSADYTCWQRRPEQIALGGKGQVAITAKQEGSQVVTGGMAARFPFTYGYVEARIRAEADSAHITSAVALLWPDTEPWPAGGEIDYYETGSAGREPISSFVHYGADNEFAYHQTPVSAEDWHVFGVDWQRGAIRVWVDGKQVWTAPPGVTVPSWPMHPTLQLDALAADCQKKLDSPVLMVVDYLRVWQ